MIRAIIYLESMGRDARARKMTRALDAVVGGVVQEFLQRLESLHGVPATETIPLWDSFLKKKKPGKKKMNCYQFFMKEERPEIIKDMPGAPFASVAKEVGMRWRALPSGEKERFRKRAALWTAYHDHELWVHYAPRPLKQLHHMAVNWFEDHPTIRVGKDFSKEEILALLVEHSTVDEEADVKKESPVPCPGIDADVVSMWRDLDRLSYPELVAMIRKDYPSFSDGSFTTKDDLIRFCIERQKREEQIPIEVHPYYYTLVHKSLDALRGLCQKNFMKDPKSWEHHNRRQLMELLIRNFEHLSLEDEVS